MIAPSVSSTDSPRSHDIHASGCPRPGRRCSEAAQHLQVLRASPNREFAARAASGTCRTRTLASVLARPPSARSPKIRRRTGSPRQSNEGMCQLSHRRLLPVKRVIRLYGAYTLINTIMRRFFLFITAKLELRFCPPDGVLGLLAAALPSPDCPELGTPSGFLRWTAFVGSMKQREQRRSRMQYWAVHRRSQHRW
jgi:hypothetical protein